MSSKRANGEGSVRLRPDGRWEARYNVQVSGATKRRSVFGRTKAEASSRLRDALTARDSGLLPAPARETVDRYLLTWVAGIRATVRPRTADSYEQIVRDHLAPAFVRIPLARLTPQLVQRTYHDLAERGLSPKTIANAHGVLHKALQQAFRWRLIGANVADLVDPPRVPRQQMTALTSEQARRVLAIAADDPLEALWRLAITCGLRQGELLALRWGEVDLERGTLSVIATLEQWRDGVPVIAEPKTSRSRRQVELGDGAVEALRRHRQGYPGIGYVFTRPDGRPLSRPMVGGEWRTLRVRAGVPAVRMHDLRHTAATLMLSRGVHPKIVSEMLGHSTVAITLDLYSHVTPTMQREAAAVMDKLLSQ
jgi:integrase